MKILAIDDNRAQCYALCRLLEHSGFEVLQAHCGLDALSLAREHMPDVILLDINLPDLSGYEVCRRLKQDQKTAAIPVVFHTATESAGSAKSYAQSVGGSAFLTYPIEAIQLASVVRGAAARAAGHNS